ncbi:MAG: HAMP domain-containing histidine kinase [Lachnospiraceae bacterium]|nr:HAMP domain-containing histidine kinase [Lachnospiraceae bacterium]
MSFNKSESNRVFKTIICFALSYIAFIVSAVIISLTMPLDFGEKYGQFMCAILQLLAIWILFHIVRFKKGMPFLKNGYYTMPMVALSVFVVITAIFINLATYNYILLIVYFALAILSTLIFAWWRTSITRSYLERLGNRNIASLNEELLQKDEYIKKLEADVERLGKIVHRDNKLVPAMEMAVERFIMDESGEMSVGSELLEELRKMSKDRKGLVATAVNADKPSVNTGVARVDTLITYMNEKAANEGITLKVTVGIDIKELLDKCIDEESFCTLLADLLDNAIIATKYNNARDVLLDMSMIKKAPAIHIFDSGIPFDKEVLINYGIEQTTTHGDDGGSGIGLMQTYEILAKCRASIFIDEFSSGLYTKKISVVFDRKRQFLLYTPREDSEVSFLKRRADLTVVRK